MVKKLGLIMQRLKERSRFNYFLSIGCAITSVAVPSVAYSASVSVIPDGLASGDQYRLVFFTSVPTSANSDNIEDYNNLVRQVVNDANNELTSLNTDWFAIVSTDNIDAISNTNTSTNITNIPVYLVTPNAISNELVANNYADLWDGTINSPINNTEQGTEQPFFASWTGTNINGTKTTNPLGSVTGLSSVGFADNTNNGWIDANLTIDLVNARSIYGISGILEVPPPTTPEPNFILSVLVLGCLIPLSKVKSN